ncbi:MAG: porin [Bradymonadia bacterium]
MISGHASADEVEKEWGYKPAKLKLSEDGKQFLRFLTWHQVWTRYQEFNPGTTVQGKEKDDFLDIGLRRSRFLAFGDVAPGSTILMHFGINNQTFNNQRKPQLYIHDAWVDYRVVPEHLHIGFGLHYWHGISRMTNASTLNLLTVDAPILNWPTIERSDQFARYLGVFFKGKLDKFEYRLAVSKPFSVNTDVSTLQPDTANYNPRSTGEQVAGYFEYQFFDKESNKLPYKVGTYLGKKKVFNIGSGFLYHPKGMVSVDTGGELEEHDILAVGADMFADIPMSNGSAFTGYLVYYHYDFGPNHLRNVGIMNVGAGGTSFNGAGNAYPTIGTGDHVYAQAGYLLPVTFNDGIQVQPFVATQYSMFEALDDPAMVIDAGINWFFRGHFSKLTVNYRSRPIFQVEDNGEIKADSRASELIMQTQVWF